MADLISRLKLESGEFDSKIARATKGLLTMEKECREVGGTLAILEKDQKEYIQSLGQMETVSQDARGKIGELTKAFTELSLQYKRLTDEEKQGDFGTALSGSLEELKTRIRDGRAELEAIEQSVSQIGGSFEKLAQEIGIPADELQNMIGRSESAKQQFREYNDTIVTLTQAYNGLSEAEKNSESGQKMAAHIEELKGKAAQLKDVMGDTNEELKHMASDTAFTDGIGLMTRTVGSCAAAITAWTGDSKEMEAVIKDLAKIGTTVAAVDQLTKVFQKQNLVLLKNPYVAAAAAVVALGVAIGKLIKKSQELDAVQKAINDVQQKGRENSAQEATRIQSLNDILHDNTRSLEERKAALSQIQQLVPDYHGALTEEGNLINDNTGAIDDYIVSLQRAATAQAAFDRMVEIQKQKMEEQLKLEKAQKELESARSMQSAGVPNGAAAFGGGGGMSVNTAVAGTNNMAVKGAEGTVNKIQSKIDELDAQSKALQALIKADDISTDAGKTKTKSGGTTTTTAAKAEEKAPEGSIKAMREQLSGLQKDWELATDDDRRKVLKDQIDEVSAALDKMMGKTKQAAQMQVGPSGYSQEGISALRSEIQGGMKGMQMGSSEYMFEAERLVDLTAFENLMKTAVANGIQIDPAMLEGLFEQIDNATFSDNALELVPSVSDEAWATLVDTINEKLADLGLDPIELDVKTGSIENAEKDMDKLKTNVEGAIGVFGQLGGAIQQIDDPAAQVAGIIMQAVANVAASFAKSLLGAVGPWDWIAAAIGGVSTMISTIAAIKSATSAGSYAVGGIVPGSSYSGDNLTANVNSGELILNRAQQGAIAGQLNSNPMGGLALSMMLKGEDIQICLDNNNRRRGR